MKRRGLVMCACALVLGCSLASSGGAATGASRDAGPCSWGASSMTATYVDGTLVESQPQTTGCVP